MYRVLNFATLRASRSSLVERLLWAYVLAYNETQCVIFFEQSNTRSTDICQHCFLLYYCPGLIPVAARSKAWVFGRSLAGIAVSNFAVGMDVCLLRVWCVIR
jgi:hypothetical protein